MRKKRNNTRRLDRFRRLAREIGAEFERQGISEEEMIEALERTKRRVYEETYGKPPEAE